MTRTPATTILDITSEVTPAGDIPVAIGPTRHAWFNARLVDGIAIDPATAPTDDRARRGAQAIPARGPTWVDYSGPVGGGAAAGLTVMPQDPGGSAWFVADWGVITVGEVRDGALTLRPGERRRFACRFVAHDGVGPGRDRHHEPVEDIAFVTPETTLRHQEDVSK